MSAEGLKPGDRVVVTGSWHSDIAVGSEGVVLEQMEQGYAVAIKSPFADARGVRDTSTRCVFFSEGEVKKGDYDTPDGFVAAT